MHWLCATTWGVKTVSANSKVVIAVAKRVPFDWVMPCDGVCLPFIVLSDGFCASRYLAAWQVMKVGVVYESIYWEKPKC